MKFGSSKARAAFFAAATVLSNISSVSGHGIEVRSCLTPDGSESIGRVDFECPIRVHN